MTQTTGTMARHYEIRALALAHYQYAKSGGGKAFAHWLAEQRGVAVEAAEQEERSMVRDSSSAWYRGALYMAARDKATDSAILGLLAEHEDIKIRLNAAENSSLSQDVIEKLSHDADISTRWAVVRNNNAPTSAIKRLARADIDGLEGEEFEEEFELREDAQERLIDIKLAKESDTDEDATDEEPSEEATP